jgi:hypothetical protein
VFIRSAYMRQVSVWLTSVCGAEVVVGISKSGVWTLLERQLSMPDTYKLLLSSIKQKCDRAYMDLSS